MSIIFEITQQIIRVKRLAEKMDPVERNKALRSVRFAELAMQQASIGDIYESLDELKEFRDPAQRPGTT